jgi:hypothetical protein
MSEIKKSSYSKSILKIAKDHNIANVELDLYCLIKTPKKWPYCMIQVFDGNSFGYLYILIFLLFICSFGYLCFILLIIHLNCHIICLFRIQFFLLLSIWILGDVDAAANALVPVCVAEIPPAKWIRMPAKPWEDFSFNARLVVKTYVKMYLENTGDPDGLVLAKELFGTMSAPKIIVKTPTVRSNEHQGTPIRRPNERKEKPVVISPPAPLVKVKKEPTPTTQFSSPSGRSSSVIHSKTRSRVRPDDYEPMVSPTVIHLDEDENFHSASIGEEEEEDPFGLLGLEDMDGQLNGQPSESKKPKPTVDHSNNNHFDERTIRIEMTESESIQLIAVMENLIQRINKK